MTHVYSYADVITRLNRNMHADNYAYHEIPDDRELAAQYLLLYELSLPYGLDLNDRINVDKSATRVTASVGEVSTVEVPNRGGNRTIGWDTVREKVLTCTTCKNKCKSKRCNHKVQFCRSAQKNERAKMLFDGDQPCRRTVGGP